ncbi:tRNA pseudouridine38-40 synthase [Rhodopseudomonas julia]|uniref:tRNA pseudouridine synthase A n=1 Tax=Rhodopseudomonas julia TaxID=200617 RepID=A0ABU0C4K9_9BRAD|nr:tRNA pseudouridine(38-40) synthase TruA [Rhodopseudomonas julia]MDQ0325157.1 tRNA pseudouridine38-40 synthase [Rhodopseudomonas julia]
MPRYRLLIEYDGAPFVGWQRQTTGPSVQAAIEDAIFAFTGEEIRIRGAGRTDTGVHALGQVAHCDLQKDWPDDTVRDALNAHLRPAPVAILAARQVAADFDARFSAEKRHYLYRIVNRRPPLAIERGRAWQVLVPLDTDAMHEAAQCLVGKHDFTTFRAAECQAKSPVKTLDQISVRRELETVVVETSARSFLHSQVRSFVGTLKLVGEGKWRARHVAEALAACDRRRCGPLAPPDGLYLAQVDYPEDAA